MCGRRAWSGSCGDFSRDQECIFPAKFSKNDVESDSYEVPERHVSWFLLYPVNLSIRILSNEFLYSIERERSQLFESDYTDILMSTKLYPPLCNSSSVKQLVVDLTTANVKFLDTLLIIAFRWKSLRQNSTEFLNFTQVLNFVSRLLRMSLLPSV